MMPSITQPTYQPPRTTLTNNNSITKPPIQDLPYSHKKPKKVTRHKKNQSNDTNLNITTDPILYQSDHESDNPPAYQCSIKQEGYIHIKHEWNSNGKLCTDKSWHRIKLSINGTSVKAQYGESHNSRDSLLIKLSHKLHLNSDSKLLHLTTKPNYECQWSIHDAKVKAAPEYAVTRPYTFRIIFSTDEQFLLRSNSFATAVRWSESLRAAINLAHDLETRPEPTQYNSRVVFCPRDY